MAGGGGGAPPAGEEEESLEGLEEPRGQPGGEAGAQACVGGCVLVVFVVFVGWGGGKTDVRGEEVVHAVVCALCVCLCV